MEVPGEGKVWLMCDLMIRGIFQYHSHPKYRSSLIISTSNLNNCLDQCNFLRTPKTLCKETLLDCFAAW